MLALAVIVKDQKEEVDRIIKDYSKYFDEIAFAVDSAAVYESLVSEYNDDKITFYKYDWCDKELKANRPYFDRKRNFLASKLKSEYYFRLDTDDTIIGVEHIRRVYDIAVANDTSIVYCEYLYAKDEWGNVNAQHQRETIIKNSHILQWNKRIHENILPKTMVGFKAQICKEIVIDHNIDVEHSYESGLRNAEALLEEYNEDRENPDPRTLAYLGRVFFSIGDFKKSIFFLQKHIEKSGWDEDKYMSWCYLAESFNVTGDSDNALSCCIEAIVERPDYPDAYAKIHDIYMNKEQWHKALEWGKQALTKKQPETFMIKDPSVVGWRLALSMSFCLLQVNEVEEAMMFFKKAKEGAPTLPFILEHENLFEESVLGKRYLEHFLWIFNYLRDKDKSKLTDLLKTIPKDLRSNPTLVQIKNMFSEPKTYEDNHVTIFCGMTPDEWADPSVLKGIGGSEEAVIYASRELVKLGYKVTVFNNCGDFEGEYKGVEYKSLYEFNQRDKYNIVISWRTNIFQSFDINAKKKIIWLHDIPFEDSFVDCDSFDKVIVLSEYHASLLPAGVPNDKIFISTNGINAKDFEKVKEERIPKRIIYASSYDRGLEVLLDNWKTIKKAVPEAQLHCFYGWDTFKKFEKTGNRDSSFRLKMQEKMEQDGVCEYGRIGHKQLIKEYLKSHVYAYPCTFKGEIQCIALTKAIACNCNIVTNKYAVMGERSPNAVNDDYFIAEVIKQLNQPMKEGVDINYVKKMSWETVVKEWDNEIFRA